MKNSSTLFLTIILAASVAWGTVQIVAPKTAAVAAQKETAYDRVMRTNTVRCGYVVYPPMLKKDMNSGQLSGIGYDIVTKIAALAKLKIDWTVETNWVNYTQDLADGKFDAMCTLDFFPPVLVGRVETTQPLFLTTMGVYKKAGDARFAAGFRDLNHPAIKISALDGSISMLLRDADYPEASLVAMPAGTDYSIILENVADGKADIAILERSIANAYMKANPGKIEDVTGDTPIAAYPYILPVAKDEVQLARLFDQAALLMQFNGEIETIVNRYAPRDYRFVDVYRNYTR